MLFNLAENGVPLVSIFFIFVFLPLSIFIYYDTGDGNKKKLLLGMSALSLLIIAPMQVPIIVVFTLVNYFCYYKISNQEPSPFLGSKGFVVLGAVVNVGAWILFGLTGKTMGFAYLLGGAVLPFLGLSALMSAYRGKGVGYSFVDYSLYLLFFPRVFVGPFGTIDDFYTGWNLTEKVNNQIFDGSIKFLFGAFRFTFLGTSLINLSSTLNQFSASDKTALLLWLSVFSFAIGIFHTFDGLMAAVEGVACCYGIKLASGWNYPFQSSSLLGFSKRFNGLLQRTAFGMVEDVYPDMKRSSGTQIISFLFVGMVMGLWIDFSTAFFMWGLILGAAMVLEVFVLKNVLRKLPKFLSKLLTMLIIIFSFAFLTAQYYNWDSFFLKPLLGIGISFTNAVTNYYLTSYIFLILLGFILSINTPYKLIKMAIEKLPKTVLMIVKPILLIFMIVLLAVLLV